MKKLIRDQKRKTRIRAKMHGTKDMPRLSVHKTNSHVYTQLIDDGTSTTILSATEKELTMKGTKTEKAHALGKLVAEKALKAKITKVIFDRGSYRYHGRVKAIAEGAREGGLDF